MRADDMPATYRTSRLQRGLSVLSVGALLLLAAAGYGLRATVQVSETAVRKTRPLWTDNVLRFEDIQRLHLPVTTEALWLYTEPNGSPDLSIEAQSFGRFGSLARRVLRRLPQHTESQDPAGRVEGYRRGGDATGENQTDDG
ncbi:hypothetical protein [Salinibacter sp.]|uniref:hypothetical protein n=1 Tax=Salinibacter sp. TaxID=2065818 RepID=UPI0021E77F90|nr:hypothetical protein [Salinibacter sp.]